MPPSFRRICATVITALVLMAVAGCGKSADELAKEAHALERAGKLSDAIIQLKAALQKSPDDPALRFYLGRLHNANLDPISAEKELRRAREQSYLAEGETAVEFARALRAQGKFKELLAEATTDSGMSASAQATLYALRGRAQHALGERAEAAESLELARQIYADSPDVAILDAQIKAGNDELMAALESIDRLLDREPSHFEGWQFKAELLRLLERNEHALSAYQKILKLQPRDFLALYNSSVLQLADGKLEEALKSAKRLRSLYRDRAEPIVQEGAVLFAQGRPREALDAAQVALKLNPQMPRALLLAGLANHELGQFEQAKSQLSTHATKDSNNLMGQRALADTLVKLNQPADAVALLEQALAVHGDDAELLRIMGDAYMALGEKDKALGYFDRAAAAGPMNSDAGVSRAIASMLSRGASSSLAELKAGRRAGPGVDRADELVILGYLAQKNVEQAQDAVTALERRAPDNPLTLNLKGAVEMVQGDRQAARVSFERALKQAPNFLPAAKNLAELDLAEQKPEDARKRFEAVIAASKQPAETLYALAGLDSRLGDRAASIASLKRLISINPHFAPAHAQLIALEIATGDVKAAATDADAALSRLSFSPAIAVLAAQALRADGNENRAIETIRRLISESPRDARSYIQVAQFEAGGGRMKDAEKTLRKGLSNLSTAPGLQLSLVSLLVNEQRFDDAMQFAMDIQARQPKAPIGFLLAGEVAEATNEWNDAIQHYETALNLQSVGQIAVKRFLARSRAGHADAALAELEKWADQHPTDVVARAKVGDVTLSKGNLKGAAMHYEKIVETGRVPLDVLNNLAYAYQQLQDERALEYAEAAYQAAPQSGGVADTLGWILLERGEIERALPLLQRAVALMPGEPEIGFHLASALARSGKKDDAVKILKSTLTSNKTFPSRAAAEGLMESLQ